MGSPQVVSGAFGCGGACEASADVDMLAAALVHIDLEVKPPPLPGTPPPPPTHTHTHKHQAPRLNNIRQGSQGGIPICIQSCRTACYMRGESLHTECGVIMFAAVIRFH